MEMLLTSLTWIFLILGSLLMVIGGIALSEHNANKAAGLEATSKSGR